MARSSGPIINPPFPNSASALNQFPARFSPMLNDHYESGIELLLRVVDIRKPRAFGGNHVLNRDPGSLSLEDPAAVFILPRGNEVPQNKEVRHFIRSQQSHKI